MAYNYATNTWELSDLMLKLVAEKNAANQLQIRKHEDWNDNYELYRGKVKTNRLTQRQAVNIPLMKETVKTIQAKMDETPSIEWQELSGDEDKELIYQEVWDDNFRRRKFELVDHLDKKNVLLYGIGTTKLNVETNGVSIYALDPFDVGFDPLTDVSDTETARFIVVQNIFRPVREILADQRYTDNGKEELKIWIESPPGITQSAENKKQWDEKIERLKAMGVNDKDFPLFAGGDRIVNLTEHFTRIWDGEDWERRVVVYAENTLELLNEPIVDLIGVDFWPVVMWTEDPETEDIYSDSVADLVRVPNKVINVWYSQMIENRTLKNFQMHWFLPSQGYTPQTYEPGPGRMLPAPPGDDISKVIRPVEISGLDDTLAAINAITQITERGTGATAIEKGEPEKGTQTLGEVQILVGKALERTIGIVKLNRLAWYERAWKWDKLMHANAPKFLKLYKTSRSGKIYPKRVYAGDWKSDAGYEPIVRSSSEQEQESIKTLQKFQFVAGQHPNNPALQKIALKRQLESLDLTPEELKRVEEAEGQTPPVPGEQVQEPMGNPMERELQDNLAVLRSVAE